MPKDLFQPALEHLAADGAIFGPVSFLDYLKDNGLPNTATAPSISIDSYERLPALLKRHDTMVLRLGAGEGKGTHFALVQVPGQLRDFFLFDDEVFDNSHGTTYHSRASLRQLYPYQVLPILSEASLVNLALSSGLMSHALNLDDETPKAAPAMGKSTFTFLLRAHSSLAQPPLCHNAGQVEVDALFVESRDGRDVLFVVEAKTEHSGASLAKHKLVYPVLSLAPHFPVDMQIAPIYMKATRERDGVHFHIAECMLPDPRASVIAIDQLTVVRRTHLILPLLQPSKPFP